MKSVPLIGNVSVCCSGAVSVAVPMTSPDSARLGWCGFYTCCGSPFLRKSGGGSTLKLANTTPVRGERLEVELELQRASRCHGFPFGEQPGALLPHPTEIIVVDCFGGRAPVLGAELSQS